MVLISSSMVSHELFGTNFTPTCAITYTYTYISDFHSLDPTVSHSLRSPNSTLHIRLIEKCTGLIACYIHIATYGREQTRMSVYY